MTARLVRLARSFLGALRGFWMALGVVVVILFVVEVVPDAWKNFWRSFDYEQGWKPDFRAASEGYGGAAWPAFHFREYWSEVARLDWRSYAYWRHRPYQGRTLTIGDDGLRKTWNRPADALPGIEARRIFMFGGSAMIGFGARDDFTIPSILARELSETTVPNVVVSNFGQTGYVSSQELLTLMEELKGGNVPDLVIFYDGVNDTFAALQKGVAGLPQNEHNRAREFNLLSEQRRFELYGEAISRLLSRLARRASGVADALDLGREKEPAARDDAAIAQGVLDRYAENMRIVNALAELYGFRVLYFWQPIVSGKRTLTPHEEKSQDWRGSRPFFMEVYGRERRDARLKSFDNFFDFSDLFSDSPDSVFIDFNHLNERGNAVVAQAMLRPVIAALAAPPRNPSRR